MNVRMMFGLGVLAVGAGFAQADLLFGIDVAADQLVEIDTSTGAVRVIGALGYDANNIELAWSGTDLYAVNSRFGIGADIMRININNGAAVDIAPVTHNGAAALAVEGFAGDLSTGALFASFRMGSGALWQANGVANLGTDGVLSNAVDTSVLNPIADWDALEFIGPGMVGADGRPNGPDVVDVHDMAVTPLSVNFRRSFAISDTFGSLNDFSWDGSRLFGMDTTIGQVLELDPVSLNLIGATPLDEGYTIVGIAPQIIIPTPAASALLGLSGVLALRRRR